MLPGGSKPFGTADPRPSASTPYTDPTANSRVSCAAAACRTSSSPTLKSIDGRDKFYSCFISYSTKDQEFAERLYADLQDKGVRCWFAPHDIKGGRKIHEQIDEAIRLHDRLLLILSEHSISSEWVKTEIAKARERESRGKASRCCFLSRWCRMRLEMGISTRPGKDSAGDPRVLHPRLQQLEGPRLVSDSLSAAGEGLEGSSEQVTT